MPRKIEPSEYCPVAVRDHLKWWGVEIRRHRVLQRVTAVELGKRIGVSHPTVGRIEKGDPAVGVSSYLSAIYSLGLTHLLAPEPTADQKSAETLSIRAPSPKDATGDDLGYF